MGEAEDQRVTTYRMTMPITFIVEINDGNAMADPRPPLQGDLPIVAVRRAMMSVLTRDKEKQKQWGVRRTMFRRPEEAKVVVMEASEVAAMDAHQAGVREAKRLRPDSDADRGDAGTR